MTNSIENNNLERELLIKNEHNLPINQLKDIKDKEKYITESFKIVGLSIRTSNNKNEEIIALWGKLFSENLSEKVINKVNNDIYCVYSNYENDQYGEYDVILGFKVSNIESLSADLSFKEFSNLT